MKDISKELLSPGEVGQLDGAEYMAVGSDNPARCTACDFDRVSNYENCPRIKCCKVGGSIYFVKA